MGAISGTYVINLDRSVERLRLFRERNPHLVDFERLSAIDGGTIDRNSLIQSGRILSDLPYTAGTLGCALSHLRLWEMAVETNKAITVLEDDTAVHPCFVDRSAAVIEALCSDWDFVQWGCTIGFENNTSAWIDIGRVPARIEGTAPVRWRNDAGYREFQRSQIGIAAPMRLLQSYGSFAYSISPKGAKLALEHCLPLRARKIAIQDRWWMSDNGIDVAMCGLYPQIKAYLCFPQLVIPCIDDSDRHSVDAAFAALAH
jgi:GR25 family glycosyltransferase involved in LPS biosynthesis